MTTSPQFREYSCCLSPWDDSSLSLASPGDPHFCSRSTIEGLHSPLKGQFLAANSVSSQGLVLPGLHLRVLSSCFCGLAPGLALWASLTSAGLWFQAGPAARLPHTKAYGTTAIEQGSPNSFPCIQKVKLLATCPWERAQ